MLKINGKNAPEAVGESLAEYLGANYDTKRVAVELNGAVLPKARYAEVTLKDGDAVEIVSFVGGG